MAARICAVPTRAELHRKTCSNCHTHTFNQRKFHPNTGLAICRNCYYYFIRNNSDRPVGMEISRIRRSVLDFKEHTGADDFRRDKLMQQFRVDCSNCGANNFTQRKYHPVTQLTICRNCFRFFMRYQRNRPPYMEYMRKHDIPKAFVQCWNCDAVFDGTDYVDPLLKTSWDPPNPIELKRINGNEKSKHSDLNCLKNILENHLAKCLVVRKKERTSKKKILEDLAQMLDDHKYKPCADDATSECPIPMSLATKNG